ncbi:hypothetical protein J1605_002265 [Eschrichtius robustus]|uniref:Uncharacterized protein n=1 Tax=Eschrichtius robustus TaxID=9764 RepID=A0AB34HTH8_ESCRO|nr:hypothetical protein J1605_002265 [Eschrichtius robustus]
MSGALDVMQVKEDVLKFLVAGTHFGGISLDFQIEQKIYKRKSDGGTFKSEENHPLEVTPQRASCEDDGEVVKEELAAAAKRVLLQLLSLPLPNLRSGLV